MPPLYKHTHRVNINLLIENHNSFLTQKQVQTILLKKKKKNLRQKNEPALCFVDAKRDKIRKQQQQEVNRFL